MIPSLPLRVLTKRQSMASGFAFITQGLFDRVTHQLRRLIGVEATEVFDDLAVARNDKALGNYGAAMHSFNQGSRQRAIIPDNLVGNILVFHVVLNPLRIVLLVV